MRSLATLFLAVAFLAGCHEPRSTESPLSKILDGLDPASSDEDRTQAVANLRELGTNALPLLVEEMNSFRWQTPEEKDERIIARTQRIREAFQVLGTNLAPIIPAFVANLDTNQNFVSALDGLCSVGKLGIPHLIGALTNRESAVRLNAVGAVMKVGMNSEVSKLATPNLLLLLNDQPALVRSLATETLGLYGDEPDMDIPPLLKAAQTDPDLVVRIQGIKAVWRIQTRFGLTSSNTTSALENISKQDKSDVVRACAERFLAGKQP